MRVLLTLQNYFRQKQLRLRNIFLEMLFLLSELNFLVVALRFIASLDITIPFPLAVVLRPVSFVCI